MRPMFDDRPVFLVGGGASLRGFNFRTLSRRQTIAINLAHHPVPWASVLFFADDNFFEEHREPHGWHFWKVKDVERIVTTAPACAGMAPGERSRVEYVDPLSLRIRDGRRWQNVHQMNSGAQAIALARKLGARTIVLLGFDNAPGHWAEGEPYMHPRQPGPEAFERYAEDFEKLARFDLGVVNATPGSALTCFPAGDLADFL